MHIPDGFLSLQAAAAAAAFSAGGLSLAVKKTKKIVGNQLVPTMGVLAAFIFAAQMFNFPVAAGTSGHLMGAALAVLVAGPWAASLVMTVVLIAQCLVFQDGGLIALGANILNMAIVAPWAAWVAIRFFPKKFYFVSVFFAAWFSIVAAAVFCALELSLSGLVPLRAILPAMAGIHAVIGIAEGLITVAVVSFVKRVSPNIVCSPCEGRELSKKTVITCLIICAAIVALASVFASSYPDGFEWVMEKFKK